jgi:kynurenine formamidase
MGQHRAVFDFRMTFTNGGALAGTGFRLDVPDPGVSAEEVGRLLVQHLGVLMVGAVEITGLAIVDEAHRGSRGVAAPAPGRRLVDLGHPIEHGMITYPGLPGPEITEHLGRDAAERSYGAGVRFHIGRISMVANTGTYMDSPYHRFDDATDLAGLPLARIADLDGVVVRVAGSGRRGVDVAELLPIEVAGRAVLIHTGWDRHWRTSAYADGAPFLTAAATAWLVAQGAALVGIDSINIDDMGDRSRPAHTGLLAAGIPIVEHLCGLEQLPPRGFRFHAAPAPVRGFGTFPVRAYAVIG